MFLKSTVSQYKRKVRWMRNYSRKIEIHSTIVIKLQCYNKYCTSHFRAHRMCWCTLYENNVSIVPLKVWPFYYWYSNLCPPSCTRIPLLGHQCPLPLPVVTTVAKVAIINALSSLSHSFEQLHLVALCSYVLRKCTSARPPSFCTGMYESKSTYSPISFNDHSLTHILSISLSILC